jgi:hypothetical protein
MTDAAIVAVAAVLTYVSRAAALTLLPASQGRVLEIIERVPAPLFGGLAVYTLFGADLEVPTTPTLFAAGAALAATPSRSLLVILAAGLAAYVVGAALL